MLIQTINPDTKIAHFCDYCNKSIYLDEVCLWGFCSFNCRRRFTINCYKSMVPVEIEVAKNEQLLNCSSNKITAQKVSQITAQNNCSSTPIWGSEQLSSWLETKNELEQLIKETQKSVPVEIGVPNNVL